MKNSPKSDQILLLGDPRLNEKSRELGQHELPYINEVVQELHDILFEFKAKYGAFRAIAAPQIGEMIRLIYMNIDHPLIIINPSFSYLSEDKLELWDDCMCFPNLLVKVERHQSCLMEYFDEHFEKQQINAEGALSELLQHEYDHLEGILATQRAIDKQSFRWRKTMNSSL
ncbi:peptide deformylase [Catalinimonas alkaloidigena]|uniref:peptide deformylase n=1 Tax=Catalinimonas alkaloidigena TaxID=1075417 RepID=UPI002404C311|nr:peptide deformylase [Catalinimonas alkaloidigena]MDF9794936.1 peptide deformylase [Catalinimonas alkaloidigena]